MTVETIQKTRRLPTSGEVLVKEGDMVTPDMVVARGVVPNPEIHELKLFSLLRIDPEAVSNHLTKHEGDQVTRDEVLAVSRSFFTRQTRVARSPIDGRIESVSPVSGRMIIRGNLLNLEVSAYIPGTVKEIIPEEGSVIETAGVRVEGLFGIGGEASGELVKALSDPNAVLTSREILPEYKGKIIVGGSLATLDALREAVRVGAKGIIVGGVDQMDLTYFLGYEIGVPVTGSENIGLTLILMGGFGENPMDSESYELFSANEGRLACINGATHIRSRSIRPEIILPKT